MVGLGPIADQDARFGPFLEVLNYTSRRRKSSMRNPERQSEQPLPRAAMTSQGRQPALASRQGCRQRCCPTPGMQARMGRRQEQDAGRDADLCHAFLKEET